MAVLIAMLRGVNILGRNTIKMDVLRELCGSLGLRDACTHLNSGNVVFKAPARSVPGLAARLEKSIERAFAFRPSVVLRTPAEMAEVISKSPFASRRSINPSNLLVYFLASELMVEARARIAQIKADPEELRIGRRELYIYFPNGQGRTKLSLASVDRALQTPATGRNWNTVTKLLEIAERLGA